MKGSGSVANTLSAFLYKCVRKTRSSIIGILSKQETLGPWVRSCRVREASRQEPLLTDRSWSCRQWLGATSSGRRADSHFLCTLSLLRFIDTLRSTIRCRTTGRPCVYDERQARSTRQFVVARLDHMSVTNEKYSTLSKSLTNRKHSKRTIGIFGRNACLKNPNPHCGVQR